jgi:hypothetical protein
MHNMHPRMIGGMNEKNTCLRCGSPKSRGRCSSLYCRMMQDREYSTAQQRREEYTAVKQQVVAERIAQGLMCDDTNARYEIQQETEARYQKEGRRW